MNMLYKELDDTVSSLQTEKIAHDRLKALEPLITYIQHRVDEQQPVRINFICTHNSRRSHLSQAWAQVLAHYYTIPAVSCYSGGTEATAMFPKAVEALQDAGFKIKALSSGTNPVYSIKYGENEPPLIGFSKTFDDPFNPSSGFAAIMTCDQANEACPFIGGADTRIPITYEDPKAFDNTPQQVEKYRERSLQIAAELKYVFLKIILP